MIELVLNKIRIDETRNEQVIILREKEGIRYLPVVIGVSEVNAIKLKLSGVKPPRPLTHDLLHQVIEKLGGGLEKVCIDKIEDGTYYAKLYLKNFKGEEVIVDARPSDSVAIALRAEVPIFAAEDVIGQAGAASL